MFGLMRVCTHDAEMAKVRGERDQANTDKRTIGAALREALDERDTLQLRFHQALREVTAERDTLQARLDALTPARGQGGRSAKREAALPRKDDKASSDAAEAAAFDAPPNRWGVWDVRHG